MNATPTLPDELIAKVEEYAIAENRDPAEVLEEAVRKFLDDRSWVKWLQRNQEHARSQGIRESDVDRLIGEYRAEQRGR